VKGLAAVEEVEEEAAAGEVLAVAAAGVAPEPRQVVAVVVVAN
jgi:hypothetical protein